MHFFPALKYYNKFYQPDKSLDDLANIYETDKGSADSESLSWGKRWSEHYCMEYTKTYARYMDSFRDSPITLFEIGICDQRFPYASLKMWLSYFKKSTIYCSDIFWGSTLNSKIKDIDYLNECGINLFYADQGSFSDWQDIKKTIPDNSIDFFIEDGSHWPNHMVYSLWQSRSLIKTGGYYFMEDLQNPRLARGKYRYDNSLLTDDLIMSRHSDKIYSSFLNEEQNYDINKDFQLIDLVLDKNKQYNYLAVFIKK
jgi:hypothetical protein